MIFISYVVCEQHLMSHVEQSLSSECKVFSYILYCLRRVLNPNSAFYIINLEFDDTINRIDDIVDLDNFIQKYVQIVVSAFL